MTISRLKAVSRTVDRLTNSRGEYVVIRKKRHCGLTRNKLFAIGATCAVTECSDCVLKDPKTWDETVKLLKDLSNG